MNALVVPRFSELLPPPPPPPFVVVVVVFLFFVFCYRSLLAASKILNAVLCRWL